MGWIYNLPLQTIWIRQFDYFIQTELKFLITGLSNTKYLVLLKSWVVSEVEKTKLLGNHKFSSSEVRWTWNLLKEAVGILQADDM